MLFALGLSPYQMARIRSLAGLGSQNQIKDLSNFAGGDEMALQL